MKKIILVTLAMLAEGCTSDFLNVKPDSTLSIPITLKDLQALLDNSGMMNGRTPSELGEIGSDNYTLSQQQWNIISSPHEKNGYIWAEDVYQNAPVSDWAFGYSKILYCNTVLDKLKSISGGNQDEYNQVEGSALFFRAYSHYNLAQLFAEPYNEQTASSQLGIPVKLTSELETKTTRASLEQVYSQIIKDLDTAAEKLPEKAQVTQRPSKAAAYYLLSRVYLQKGDYAQALIFAQKTLEIYSELTDFSTIDAGLRYPFQGGIKQNKEVIFHSWMQTGSIFSPSNLQIPSELLDLYAEDDYRKKIFFFKNSDFYTFKGSYQGGVPFFTGFTTSEMYLTAAECFQRLGDTHQANTKLNQFLKKRIINYIPISASGEELLTIILKERRKELVFRGIRWEDLRRLNKDTESMTTITRILNDIIYKLEPGDKRYIWPIPTEVILLSGIEQNPR